MNRRLLILFIVLPLLVAGLLAVGWFTLLHTTAGAGWALSKAQEQIPGEIKFAQLEGDFSSGLVLEDLHYRDTDLQARAQSLRIKLSPRVFPLGLVVDSVEVQSLDLHLSGSGENTGSFELPESLSLPFPVDVRDLVLDVIEVFDADGTQLLQLDRIALAALVHESLELRQFHLAGSGLELDAAGSASLERPFPMQLDLSSRLEIGERGSSGLTVLENESRLDGAPENYSLGSSGFVQPAGMEKIDLQFEAAGNTSGLEISTLKLSGGPVNLVASGALQWSGDLQVDISSRLAYLDVSAFMDDWPASEQLGGQFSARLAGNMLEISEIWLETADAGMRVEGQGELQLEAEQLQGELSWSGLQWPIQAEEPGISSRTGSIRLAGTVDQWVANGQAQIKGADVPEGSLKFELEGDREHARLQILDSQVLGGKIGGEARYNWLEEAGSARLELRDLHTEAIASGLPGVLSGDLALTGRQQPFLLDLDVKGLNGQLQGLPVSASGRILIEPDTAVFEAFRVRSFESLVSLDGSLFTPGGVRFDADIIDLGSFAREASGTLQANGRLSLGDDGPALRLALESSALDWSGSRVLDGLVVNVADHEQVHTLSFSAQKDELDLSASLAARMENAGAALADLEWSGRLDSLELSRSGEAFLELQEPAGFELSTTNASLQEACMGIATAGLACASSKWGRAQGVTASLLLEQVPVQLVNLFMESGFEFSQLLAGDFHWQSEAGGSPSGKASLRMSPGDIRFAGDSEVLFSTGPAVAGFILDQGRLTAGQLDIPFPGNGMIDLDFSVDDLVSGLNAGLDGRIVVSLDDLDIFSVMVPLLEESDGRFNADLNFSGTVGQPLIKGSMALQDGMILHELTGLRIEDIQLAGQQTGTGDTRLLGSFHALEGEGHLEANVDFSEPLSPAVSLKVKGENLTLFDVPEIRLVVTPDIEFGWRDGLLSLDGSLLIPSALFAPSEIRQAPVGESPDLVIVSGEENTDGEHSEKPPIAVRGQLEVVLGEDVAVDVNLAKLDLGGSVIFSWQDDMVPVANGNYSLAGEILAYGQLLEITRGNIGFPRVPADNPHLNIRAERQIFGNSEVQRAGLFISGTLRRPVIEPYTDPMTNRERAQTLLITGSDFNMETGVGAVDIGTYIAPRIFVSYGFGVFEEENVVSVRYDLGRGWGVKVTSGQRQTGVDMSYTLER